MLVLTRKVEQEIRIGNDIVIKVIEVRGNSVRLGIEAPRSVKVLRQELQLEDTSRQELEPAKATVAASAADPQGSPIPAAAWCSREACRSARTSLHTSPDGHSPQSGLHRFVPRSMGTRPTKLAPMARQRVV